MSVTDTVLSLCVRRSREMGDTDRGGSSRRRSRSPSTRRRRRRRRSSHSSDSNDSREQRRDRHGPKRLVDKIEKHLKKHSRSEPLGYRDEDNPFGDSNLSQRFVWGKKIERELKAGASIKDYSASAHSRRDYERLSEIEKIKRKREEREAERAAIAEELELLQRERARSEAVELEKQEDLFHLEQAKVRAQQRLAAGRPKAIDVITNNLFLLDGFDKTAEDPNTFISGLTVFQLKELAKDIQEYSRLDAVNTSHSDFWKALAKVTHHVLWEAEKQEHADQAAAAGEPVDEGYMPREAGWHPSLESDIADMLDGKRLSELKSLEESIVDQLEHGDAPDPDYWYSVLKRLDLYKAKSMLREFHENVVERELQKIKQGIYVPTAAIPTAERAVQAQEEALKSEAQQKAEHDSIKKEASDDTKSVAGRKQGTLKEEDTKSLGHLGEHGLEEVAEKPPSQVQQPTVTIAEELYRKAVSKNDGAQMKESDSLMQHITKSAIASSEKPEERKLKAIAAQTMGHDKDDDASADFGTEVNISSRVYSWQKHYKTCKPKYFNKVHTTFFWTKYNKAHYDRDNPPPKIVSGYKFNIFYPDLVDPSKTPTYSIEKDVESPDDSTCILRFSAGAPYEDIAFRIINKKWNTDPKSGFRCVFDRGILQLYFRFMMQFYKR